MAVLTGGEGRNRNVSPFLILFFIVDKRAHVGYTPFRFQLLTARDYATNRKLKTVIGRCGAGMVKPYDSIITDNCM